MAKDIVRTSSISVTSSCSLFPKAALPKLVARVAFAFIVLLGKEYGGGGDNGVAEGVTGSKIFCCGDNGGAVGASLGLLLGTGGSGGNGGGPCKGGGGGGGQKFELNSFLFF